MKCCGRIKLASCAKIISETKYLISDTLLVFVEYSFYLNKIYKLTFEVLYSSQWTSVASLLTQGLVTRT